MDPIYLDYNATTPLHPSVAEAMAQELGSWGNPSSSHWAGRREKAKLTEAREEVAKFINASPEEIFFTGGGSESDNWAVKGTVWAFAREKNVPLSQVEIVCSVVEHYAVIKPMRWMRDTFGCKLSLIEVDSGCFVKTEQLEKLITPNTAIVSIMHANNEVGAIQPIADIARICHRKGTILHVDAAQSLGKVPMDVVKEGVDMLTMAGHKFYGPKGVGALYVRRREVEGWPSVIMPDALIQGAPQEQSFRAGTENVMGIVGMGEACRQARMHLNEGIKHMSETRNLLEDKLTQRFPDAVVNCPDRSRRLPNTLNISFPNIVASEVSRLLTDDIALSIGAACASLKGPSVVSATLTAMNITPEMAVGTLRLSTGRLLTMEQAQTAVEKIEEAVESVRSKSG